jgi:hypothetical protein
MEFLTPAEKEMAEIVLHPATYSSKGNSHYRDAAIERFPYIIVYRIYKRKKEIFISAVNHVKKSPRKKYCSF